MRVLVIPEDVKNDQYILKPIVEAMLQAVGKPHARVTVCQNPRLRGISQALKWDYISEIVEQYKGMYQLLLLCVDRDGEPDRRQSLDRLEEQASTVLHGGRLLLAEHAWQEIEVWLLAGHDLPAEWTWQAIRAERDAKERYYLPFAMQRDVWQRPAQGRKTLAAEAARRYERIRQRCPEDIAHLEQRIRVWIATA